MRKARIGELNQRITIQRATVTVNDYGEEIVTWGTLAVTWAAIRNVPQREPFAADQFVSVVTTSFTLRYRTDVTAKMRVSCAGKVYEIDSAADPDGARRFIELQCTLLERGA
jgi:SPP1 family predicted phage head-tail adaptor